MKNSTTLIAFITAVALHLIVGAVLLIDMDFSLPKDKPKKEVEIINASVVNQKIFDDLAKRKAQIKADKKAAEQRKREEKRKEKQRIKAAEKKRKAAEKQRAEAERKKAIQKQKEEERILFEEIVVAKALRAKQEAEKRKKIAEEKFKKEEAQRIKKAKAEAKRVEAEKKAAAEALKAKQVAEAKRKAEEEKAAKEAKRKAAEEAKRLRQEELDKQMEAEFENAFSNAQSAKQLSEIARYQTLIRNKISRNWQLEPSMKGKSCKLRIRLAPDGLVLTANRSEGDQKLCESAKRAALKAKTLPIPKDPEIAPQFRDFDITLEPEL